MTRFEQAEPGDRKMPNTRKRLFTSSWGDERLRTFYKPLAIAAVQAAQLMTKPKAERVEIERA